MGCEDWFDRNAIPITPTFDVEDFPGHSFCEMRCGCGTTFRGIFKTTVDLIVCPKCKERGGVELVRELRKIWLQ